MKRGGHLKKNVEEPAFCLRNKHKTRRDCIPPFSLLVLHKTLLNSTLLEIEMAYALTRSGTIYLLFWEQSSSRGVDLVAPAEPRIMPFLCSGVSGVAALIRIDLFFVFTNISAISGRFFWQRIVVSSQSRIINSFLSKSKYLLINALEPPSPNPQIRTAFHCETISKTPELYGTVKS